MSSKHDKRIIFSAAEVGTFVVCPESWRLRKMEKVVPQSTSRVEHGEELHKQWASDYDEANFLFFMARVVVLMVLLAIFVYVALQ